MKKQPDYLSTSLWYRNLITDPYQVIAEFFSAASIVSHRKIIKGAIIAFCTDRLYRKESPGDVLHEFKLLESVINAAYIINLEKKENPLDISESDLFNKNLYYGKHRYLTEWECFPRSLSMKEYINPYLVFKKFFKYQELGSWKNDLQEILEFSLVKTSCLEGGTSIDILSIYFHLTKLVEAAHLIDVREVTHVGGQIKNKF